MLKYNRDRKVAAIAPKVKIGKKGNIKLGSKTWTISKLAGNNVYRAGNETQTGTCGHFCGGCQNDCYVIKSYRNDSVIRGHFANTAAMRKDVSAYFDEVRKQIASAKTRPDFLRGNQSGELESAKEAIEYVKTAAANPGLHVWLYSKNYLALAVCLQLYQDKLPENITFLVSVWHEYGIAFYNQWKHIRNVKAFVYNDGFDYAKHGIIAENKCHAYQGKKLNHAITCEACGLCTDKRSEKVIFCDAH